MPIPNGGSAAVAAAARDGVPPPSRFAHLLQPIRDVAANWAVDVAAELEAYLTDIEAAEAALSATDFTTAALLVQGSAGVYARKVEHLYSLVFRALDLVRAHADGGGGGGADGAGRDGDDGSGRAGAGRDRRAAGDLYDVEVEWTPLDVDVPQAGDGLDLPPPKPVTGLSRDFVLAVVPIALLPPPPVKRVAVSGGAGGATPAGGGGGGGSGGGSSDFRLDVASVHPSGALLLDEDVGEGGLLDAAAGTASGGGWFMGANAYGSADDGHGGGAGGGDAEGADDWGDDGGGGGGEDFDDGGPPGGSPSAFGSTDAMDVDGGDSATGGAPLGIVPNGGGVTSAMAAGRAPLLHPALQRLPPADAFRLHDPHARPAVADHPLRRAVTYRRPPADAGRAAATPAVPSLLAALAADMTSPCWLLAAAVGPPPAASARGARYVGVGELGPALCRLAASMAAARRRVAAALARAGAAAAAAAAGVSADAAADDGLDGGDWFDDPLDGDDGGDGGGEFGGLDDDGGDAPFDNGVGGGGPGGMGGGAGGGAGVSPFDAVDFDFSAADETEDAVRSLAAAYDAACRRYVAESAAAWERHAADPALASRVSEWAARVTPALEAESTRPPFDIAAVGVDVLVRFGHLTAAAAAEEAAAAAAGAPNSEGGSTTSAEEGASTTSAEGDESDGSGGHPGRRPAPAPRLSPGRPKRALSRVVGGAPKVDVCRRFLAALQLAADGKIVLDVQGGWPTRASSAPASAMRWWRPWGGGGAGGGESSGRRHGVRAAVLGAGGGGGGGGDATARRCSPCGPLRAAAAGVARWLRASRRGRCAGARRSAAANGGARRGRRRAGGPPAPAPPPVPVPASRRRRAGGA
ncbi:hypothetical protein BU14_0129s0003 [Porphyra umbilicalis]|uniref:Condensin II complex subunit H2 N-terminal domain-containing protein n=1 Tax=Porphyra umbilicalis TaxID=2786 RepID=A0A1X6PAM0_PORUM|nr:hypothetical protein BU14_0129s0003 [Porphyra umbilicalis]|eukprot:OSX77887.1 hypothetical protein BU14_0129s0003 [Porphyra umbilicalis]